MAEKNPADDTRAQHPTVSRQAPFSPTEIFTIADPAGRPVVSYADPLGPNIEGKIVAGYELLGRLGEGGMGIVYRARQQRAGRIVALKIVRPDLLHRLKAEERQIAVARFFTEARAAARLEHEHIVTVYEVGEAEGLHYFSMRYVEGPSLAELLRDGPLEGRRAASLLEPVARAIAAAHLVGVLHRDLKPQNILVDARTDRALVADFGVAKCLDMEEGPTRHGEVLGTPQYMSPEQFRDSAHVTAAADVYSLGALLYTLLTGRPPHHAATPVETLRQVLHDDPVPPRKLNAAIDRELETICLKCLEKEPARRMQSAEMLADELHRYLQGEPILSHPLSRTDRAVRWCQRNRLAASMLGIAVLGVLVALTASTAGYLAARAARAEADASFHDARDAVDGFFTWFSEEALLDQPGLQQHREDLLERALNYYKKFLAHRGNDPGLKHDIAQAQWRVGLITEELDSPAAALPLYRSALASLEPIDAPATRADVLNAMGRVQHKLGQLDESLAAYKEAIRLREELAKAAPNDREAARKLASSYMNLGLVERDRGDLAQAISLLERSQSLRHRLLDEASESKVRRDLAMGYQNRASLAHDQEQIEAAASHWRQAVALFEQLLVDEPFDLHNQYRLAVCFRGLGDAAADVSAALPEYESAVKILEPLARQNPRVVAYQAELASLYINVGESAFEQQKHQLAKERLLQAREILIVLSSGPDAEPGLKRQLSGTVTALDQVEAEIRKTPGEPQKSDNPH